ncbi:hypothetical protein METBIDRAFT_12760 [Metschnikowia bicuspidata var. bicuspidata NRRL YB-4993]|uniref:UvrD-like helicase ATP-binding domain-containing protein n=1 Tax=Metschnikowia bicuspidata var. bicuspidata NRRL YB-4993 TaxID=869754 RepID=A0A1A0H724_9ASCO|nr:hypothetical protein METBIDRAFT_12760 [Metschnikowia bicuspidata var. bicuspidata NRRL YB-4993]OBA19707.1 hypothetical protein METBIDRAFT_12760 [Metschnikowia bicuspidata var. bicuspidata NRRL YB-4993]
MPVPQDWHTLASDIVASYKEPGNSPVQEQIFKQCIRVLSLDAAKDETHLFCRETLNVISGHTLIMFSFPGTTSPMLQVVEDRMARSLLCCCTCVRAFYTSLSQLRSRFVLVRRISVEQVLKFLAIVDDWVFRRLEPRVHQSSQATASALLDSVRLTLYEYLSNVSLLRTKPTFRSAVATLILSSGAAEFLQPDHLLPLSVFYYVEGNSAESAFAQLHLKTLHGSAVTLDPQVVDEILHQCYRLQNLRYFSQDFSLRFWQMMSVVLDLCPGEEFSKLLETSELEAWSAYTQIRLSPLVRVFFNNLLACLDKPFPVLLDVFGRLLRRFGSRLWAMAPEFHFTNVLDAVLRSPLYHKHLHLASVSGNPEQMLKPLLEWIPCLVSSLSGPQKQTAAIKFTDFLVHREKSEPGSARVDSAELLHACFETLDDSLDSAALSVSLLKMLDARMTVNRYAEYFVNLARNGSKHANALVCVCLKYDIIVASHNSSVLQQKKSPTLFEANNALWAALARAPFTLAAFASGILSSFTDALSVIIFKDTKDAQLTRELDASLKIHNRDTEALCKNVSIILEKIGLMDVDDLKAVLATESCLEGIWSCIFNTLMSQAALTLVSQVFDSEDRYEGIFALLNSSLRVNIMAINKSLCKIATMSAYEPCPKALRILMDIINALTGPLNGILNTQSNHHVDSILVIRDFWESSWRFLVMIYKRTLVWAGLYHLSDLIEFTRDTLDTSHLLLDSFRVLMDYFANSSFKSSLFDTFMATFIHLIVWLRLGDTSLLYSCVNLVFKGFDLAKELDARVDKDFIVMFAKYGAKAKKFNNKLTEQQRSLILAKASEFDAKLVQYVIDESAKERLSMTPPVNRDARSEQPKAPSYIYQTHNKGSKQSTLARFGVVTTQAPVAPPPPKPFKLNNLEAIRSELKNNRAPPKPVINPAPPRPAGFNHKSTAVGRSLNALKNRKHDSDSSDEDAENDVDTSDLFLDSKKKPKIIEVDINGRRVQKMPLAKKVDTKRQEEERMRQRLNVNLKPLYSTVLRWNYNTNSEFPTEDRDIYKPIKDSYSSAKEYVSEIEPLLMLECWQGIQSSRVTGQELPFELLLGSRVTCDGFFDVHGSMKKTELAARKIGETDLLVLGYVADKDISSPHEISKYLKLQDSQTCLAKVREIKSANQNYSDITVRVYPQGSMVGLLSPQAVIVGMKVMQMITVEREFSSLRGLPYYDLCDEILAGKPCEAKPISDAEASSMCGKLGVNMSQAKAIIGANRDEGFSLIQGPPGTGKTKTILGIVGHFLSSVSANPHTIITPVLATSASSEETKPVKKVLICAPSNAAVDELVVRLKDGVVNDSGHLTTPKIVRLGRPDAMNASVRHLCLEELIEGQLKARYAAVDPSIRLEINKCISEKDRLKEALKREDLRDPEIVELQAQLQDINKKRSELSRRLEEQKENAAVAYRTREIEKRQAQAKILSEAQVICSTLSGSAHDFLASMSMKFDQVIIDEACQCVELSAIIPLRYGCKKCVMVGDPNQLPPTVLSQKAASFKYEESLFVRMQRNNSGSIYLLDVQYRMHPEISVFPSAQFYNSRLSDGDGMQEKNQRLWHSNFPLTPYRFFDIVSRQQQNQQTKSFFNTAEARVALELVETLMKILPENKFKGRIGIISPYKEQIRTLRDTFQRKFGNMIFSEIDFNTVDGFQGQEKEIIIMSCVRASENGSVGFLSDVRRMNVALTRARTTLWILGNKTSLRRDRVWNKLVTDAESRSCVSSAQPGFLKNLKMSGVVASGVTELSRHPRVAKDIPETKAIEGDSPFASHDYTGKDSYRPVNDRSKINSHKSRDKNGGGDSCLPSSSRPENDTASDAVGRDSYRPASTAEQPVKDAYRPNGNLTGKPTFSSFLQQSTNSVPSKVHKRKLEDSQDQRSETRKSKKNPHVYIHTPRSESNMQEHLNANSQNAKSGTKIISNIPSGPRALPSEAGEQKAGQMPSGAGSTDQTRG